MHRNKILFNWTNLYGRLADKDLAEWWASLEESATAQVTKLIKSGQLDERWLACKDLHVSQSAAQAERLGHTWDRGSLLLSCHAGVVVDKATGHGAGQELIRRWEFRPESEDPESMWDIMDFRVDGEAVVGLVGDRGWTEEDWVYMVIVAWYPKEVHGKCSPETALI